MEVTGKELKEIVDKNGVYCPVCGNTPSFLDFSFTEKKGIDCHVCGHPSLEIIPEEYEMGEKYVKDEQSLPNDEWVQRYQKRLKRCQEEFIFKNPLFDRYKFDHSIEIMKAREYEQNKDKYEAQARAEEQDRKRIAIANPAGVRCPYCNSNDVRKLKPLQRGLSIGLFGLRSKSVGKQWRCNNCGSDF